MVNMVEPKQMTVKEVVEQVINDLEGIDLRMSDFEKYGFPIGRAIAGLKQVCAAWEAQEQQEQNGEEPEIEIVQMEETNNAET